MDESTPRTRIARLRQANSIIEQGSPSVHSTVFDGRGLSAIVPLSTYEGIASELAQLRATAKQFDLAVKKLGDAIDGDGGDVYVAAAAIDVIRLATPPTPRED